MSNIQHLPGAARHTHRLHKTVAMVGMMGAGKTAVGRALAARLDVPFLDSDTEIEAASNLSVPEIFSRFGEPFFREKEARVISRLLDGDPCILSTGGGAFLAEGNRAAVTQRGLSLWLDADVDLLWSRVKHKSTRPLLMTDNPRATLEEIFDARVPTYAQADLSVKSAPGLSIEEMVDRVLATLTQRSDVLEEIKKHA